MYEQILSFKKTAKGQMKQVLRYTNYKRQIHKILAYYLEFLKMGVESNLINEKNINLFEIKNFDYIKGNAYAAWGRNCLTLEPKFFNELSDEDKKVIIFHECLHAVNTPLLSKNNENVNNFYNYLASINDIMSEEELSTFFEQYSDMTLLTEEEKKNPGYLAREATQLIDEYTTQFMAELMTQKDQDKIRKYDSFPSKILCENSGIKSNFRIYPEYQQIFTCFLRTINGLGGIKEESLLFNIFYRMLQNGYIWHQIIGTYSDKGKEKELLEFLMTLAILKRIKDDSIASNLFYFRDKERLTRNIYYTCLKMNKMINNDNYIGYSLENNKNEKLKSLNK